MLKKVVTRTLELDQASKEEQSLGAMVAARNAPLSSAPAQAKNSEAPSLDFRMQTARFLTELAQWRDSVKVLETVVGDDDERIEALYLLAFAMFRLKKYATAEECCTSVKNLIIKLKVVDPDLEAGTREIYEELCKHKAKTQQKAAAQE